MKMTLNKLKVGDRCRISRIELPPALTDRLQVLGMIPQTEVECRYRSPGGTVTALEFRGSVLAIRTKELEKVLVEKL